jgi:hypothetical protein
VISCLYTEGRKRTKDLVDDSVLADIRSVLRAGIALGASFSGVGGSHTLDAALQTCNNDLHKVGA